MDGLESHRAVTGKIKLPQTGQAML